MTGYLASIDIDLISEPERTRLVEYAKEGDIDIDDAITEIVSAALRPRPTIFEYTEAPVRITRDSVYFGDEKLPGAIAEGGIVLKPGRGTDVNRLTITYLVGPVTADDPFVTTTEEIPSATASSDPITRYHSREPQADDGTAQLLRMVADGLREPQEHEPVDHDIPARVRYAPTETVDLPQQQPDQ